MTQSIPSRGAGIPWQNWLVRGYRLVTLLAAAWLLHLSQQRMELAKLKPLVDLSTIQRIFPGAVRLGPGSPRQQSQVVYDARGVILGQVLRTSPQTDDLIGYTGPNDILIALGPDGRILEAALLFSGDTRAHVDSVRFHTDFWSQFTGWLPSAESPPPVEGVSGSTLTSLTIAEAIQRRLAGTANSLRFPTAPDLKEARQFFPQAAVLQADVPRPGWLEVTNAEGRTLGYLLRTSPVTDGRIGYAGPTDSLLVISADRTRLLDVQIRSSYDTDEYVDRVRDTEDYFRRLASIPLADWPDLDFQQAEIEGVSGATQTSFAVADGIRRRLRADRERSVEPEAARRNSFRLRDAALIGLIGGAFFLTFGRFSQKKRWRAVWQILVMIGLGYWLGDLVSLALLAGWSRSSVATSSVSLVLLVLISLLTPWTTRQQIYCHQLCPHGAAQEWISRYSPWRIHLPARLARILGLVPGGLLIVAFVVALTQPDFELSWLEPFDGWSVGAAATVSFVLMVVSLLMSIVLPQSYCRYGCPTGALLKYVRSHGGVERFGKAEGLAGLVIAIAGGWLLFSSPLSSMLANKRESQQQAALRTEKSWQGEAFGTTWSVRFRGNVPTPISRADLVTELERIESQLSHWRRESQTAQFNASETTLELEYSPELIELVQLAKSISEQTDGAYDITVGPLVDAWGFGPSGPHNRPPDAATIERLKKSAGIAKINIFPEFSTLQKEVPGVQIDLGSLLQGYAADRLFDMLRKARVGDVLINVGGEMRCSGQWNIAIDAISPELKLSGPFPLDSAAIATSGTYRPSGANSRETRHIISPHTGRPVETNRRLCSVIASTAVVADAWATALFLLPEMKAVSLADQHGFSLLLIDADGHAVRTGTFAKDRPFAEDRPER